MTSDILLSIIIPYYNSDEWIGGMLDSLLDQDLPCDDYEIIVVDDGSTQSPTTLMNYVRMNPIIKHFRKENGGVSSARNFGIDIAKGKWIYFCDSDDVVTPKVIGSLIDKAEQLDLEMLICDYRLVQTDGKIIVFSNGPSQISEIFTGKDYLASFISNPFGIGFAVWRFFVKKTVLVDNSIRFENLAYIEDSIFQLDLLFVVKRIAHANVTLYSYLQHETSITHSQKREKYELYATWLWFYLVRLSNSIKDSSLELSANAISVLKNWRDWGIYELLTNCFRYCPVSTTKLYLKMISELDDAYPLKIIGNKKYRFVRRIMGYKGIWIALCRVCHLLPLRLRQ